MKLNQTIKKIRKDKGLTQEQLAELLGVSLMTIRRWEWGNTSPNSKMLLKLADVFCLSPEELLSGDDIDDISVPSYKKEPNKKALPNMAYWGGVADNAKNVAEYGNDEEMADVSHMLRRALAYLAPVSGKSVALAG